MTTYSCRTKPANENTIDVLNTHTLPWKLTGHLVWSGNQDIWINVCHSSHLLLADTCVVPVYGMNAI